MACLVLAHYTLRPLLCLFWFGHVVLLGLKPIHCSPSHRLRFCAEAPDAFAARLRPLLPHLLPLRVDTSSGQAEEEGGPAVDHPAGECWADAWLDEWHALIRLHHCPKLW